MIAELDRVILTTNIPEYSLEKGDMGTVVLVHQGGKGYEVEFVTLDGETVAIVSLLAAQVRPISSREIAHARVIN
jgi:ATP-dependent exoDNAse (exonuclease V) alpha subunit